MNIKCRAQITGDCMNGMECEPVYGEDSMRDDGLFDGTTVICDACYMELGAPSLRFPASRDDVIKHVDAMLAVYKKGVSTQ